MTKKPYVLVKCAMSLDGHLDDLSDKRLILSNADDFDIVDQVRAESDAILVGAQTIRKDNPKLLVKSEKRRTERLAKGLSESPIKVTITSSGDLSPDANFFITGNVEKIVFCTEKSTKTLQDKLGNKAEVIELSPKIKNSEFILKHLASKGIKKLLVEGGSHIITMFLEENLVDELQVSIAPFFVGESGAPKFVNSGKFPYDKDKRMNLKSVDKVGDMAVLTFILNK